MLDFCGYSNAPPTNNTKSVLWLRNTGLTDSDSSGPDRDHTTDTDDGWYVYVPLDAQSSGVAILQSELLGPFDGTICFSFYYHILSETFSMTTKLLVQYMSPYVPIPFLVANLSSSHMDRWIMYNKTFTNLPQGRFQFKTFQGQTSRADVALDDISVKVGSCGQSSTTTQNPLSTTPEPKNQMQWDCNFESTPCKWKVTSGTGLTVSSWATSK